MTVCNRTIERAMTLCKDLRSTLPDAPGSIDWAEWDARSSIEAEAWVNCTAMGMAGGGAETESPLDMERIAAGDAVILDTVYAPRRTPLLASASGHPGIRTIDGVRVFVAQAIAQSGLWMGPQCSQASLESLFTRVSEEILAT
ncbi:MAG: hypothetical protein ACNA8P_09370 [Phycisphaerales bacterium]